MDQPVIGSLLTVRVTKITMGKDGKLYVTINHQQAMNQPTFIWKSQ